MPSLTRLSYTFIFSTLLVLFAAPHPSAALSNHGHEKHVRVAQHLAGNRKRMEKRLVNQLGPGGLDQTATSTTQPVAAAAAATPTSATPTTAAVGGQQTTPTPTPTADNNGNTSNGGILDSLFGQSSSSSVASSIIVSTTASTVSSLSSTLTSSSAVVLTTTPSSTPTIAINTNTQTSAPASKSLARGTVSITSIVGATPTASSAASTSSSSANTFGKNTIIAIAVIAGGIGGAAAIWTLIRKWKLGPSAKFDNRMQPIEWSPDGESGLPGAVREKTVGGMSEKARPSSTGSAGSFHSGGADHGRNVTGNGNMFADQEPAHDFTAGPAQLHNNYEYNTGYVDLQRNNSGGSTGAADLTRARSQGAAATGYGHGYDFNAHDQAYAGNGYEGNDAAYAQDAYGGYETHTQHQYPADQYGNYSHDPHATNYNQATYQGGRY